MCESWNIGIGAKVSDTFKVSNTLSMNKKKLKPQKDGT